MQTLSAYNEGVVWVVGISAAAVAGGFLNLDKISGSPFPVRVLFLATIFIFLLTVYCGVRYAFCLLHARNMREKIAELTSKAANDLEPGKYNQQIADREHEITKDDQDLRWIHPALLWSFPIGLSSAAILLGLAVFLVPSSAVAKTETAAPIAKQIPVVASDNYRLVYSAVHRHSNRSEAHTFLLNETTGEIWQMVCRTNKEVEFRRVHRLSLSGSDEVQPNP